MICLRFLFLAMTSYCLVSCYSFKSAGIPPEMETFYVEEFDNTSTNVVPTLAIDFTQKLIDQIRNESRLTRTEYEPHVAFSGAIAAFRVTSIAPEEGARTAFNRLEIVINVKFKNNITTDEKKKEWQQSFSFFEDYPSDTNLLDIQDSLIENITDQIVEDIFNKAFSDW